MLESAARFNAGVVLVWIAVHTLLAVANAAEDPTFREFPDSEVATPAELIRSLNLLQSLIPAQSRAASLQPNRSSDLSEPPEEETTPSTAASQSSSSPQSQPTIPRENEPARSARPSSRPQPVPGGQNASASRPPSGRTTSPIPRSDSESTSSQRSLPMDLDLRDAIRQSLQNESRRPRVSPPEAATVEIPQSSNRLPTPGPTTNPQPRNLPEPPFTQSPASRDSTGQADPPPQGSFRDRLNRILLDAAQDSFAKKTSDAASLNAFERAFSRATDSMKDSLDSRSPGWRQRISDQWNRASQRVRRSRDESAGWLRRGTRASSGAANSNNAIAWLLAAIGLLVIVAVAFISRRRIGAYLGQQPRRTLKRLRFALRAIDSRRDLILAVDRFLLWSLGAKAGSWNCQVIKESLVTTYPQLGIQIEDLVEDYEQARYAPESCAILPSQLKRCAATLRYLVAAESAHVDYPK